MSKTRHGIVFKIGGWFLMALLYGIGLVAVMLATFAILHIPPFAALQKVWEGAVGNTQEGHLYSLSETFVLACPLLLTGLGVVVSWRVGMFSIGGQGQLLMGALAATALVRYAGSLPPPLITAGMLIFGCLGGALWGLIAGWLKVHRNVQEVISTIMLNYLAIHLVAWLVLGPLREKEQIDPASAPLLRTVLFPRVIPTAWSGGVQTSLHSGVFLALAVVPLISLLLFRTRIGFQMRVIGQNPEAARVAKYAIDRLRLSGMAISGGLCGLAGAIELLGSATGRLSAYDFSGGTGYTAIPVALLGGLHPIETLFTALLFGGLTRGCNNLEQDMNGVSHVLLYVIQASAVLAVVGARAWQGKRSGQESE